MKTAFRIAVALGAVFTVFMVIGVFIAGWERPPMVSKQIGYRGLGMEQITNPRLAGKTLASNQVPELIDPAPPGGRPAREAYTNVQVLGDLTEDQFNRIMVAITAWVSPEQGCGYCHNLENLADDVPHKVVARRMFQMTKHLNQDWTTHVAQTGVTCYTCHRGKPLPAGIWFPGDRDGPAKGMAGYDGGQNHPSPAAALASLPLDPFTGVLDGTGEARVVGKTALPTGKGIGASIQKTEHTYALMMHISNALGVNCTYCHNSRAFLAWDQSVPTRATAFYGIRMVRYLNNNFLTPLRPAYEPARLGPQGQAPQLNCVTCHHGQPKPLGGAQMLKDYPELNAAILTPVPGAGPAPAPASQ
ncbi:MULTISPECIES: photosynthetic reaction center cytochrome PufC [Rhodomicrobium]|uniref:photosynthetic reaction center cytochrome PufC n=1 Tax=Rhodomicrobium TaxID=1068 RepID=UPI000B4A5FF1|nr:MULTISPECIES: photosynthetic reaction center cytochrome PufC [Rhodomicrobium]